MANSKQKIETYEQFRKRLGKQFYPSISEVNLIRHIYKEEMSKRKGEFGWVLCMIYLAGKMKGSGIVTKKDMDIIADSLLNELNKEAHTTGNSESSK